MIAQGQGEVVVNECRCTSLSGDLAERVQGERWGEIKESDQSRELPGAVARRCSSEASFS